MFRANIPTFKFVNGNVVINYDCFGGGKLEWVLVDDDLKEQIKHLKFFITYNPTIREERQGLLILLNNEEFTMIEVLLAHNIEYQMFKKSLDL